MAQIKTKLTLDVSLPCDFDAVNVIRIFFDSGQETDPDFRSGVNRNTYAQEMKHQGGQTFDEKHLMTYARLVFNEKQVDYLRLVAIFIFLP